MNKKKPIYVGIDVSKDTFNTHCNGNNGVYKNNRKGWHKFHMQLPYTSTCVMEATGVYHVKLASYLHDHGLPVLVLNPLRVNRYKQSLGLKAKTDKVDAVHIAEFAALHGDNLHEWEPLSPKHARARAIVTILSYLARFSTAFNNVNHAIDYMLDNKDKDLLHIMSSVKDVSNEQQKAMEKELCKLAKELFPQKYNLLKSIPGLGDKTVSVMLVCAKGMDFETSGKMVSFVGLAPSVYESGTSVRGKGRTVKTGNPYLRQLLFMCAFTAMNTCQPCKELYERLVAKGKPKMLALVAVMHRLVKIAYGVVQSNEPFRGGKKVALA